MDEGADENTANTPAPATVTIDYTRVDTGKDLVDEMGGKFGQKTTTTMKGTGTVQSVCLSVCVLELNTAEKSFVFTAPIGFNAQTDTYENLVKAGVIDPTKVVRTALQNAASVAGLLVTTEAAVADLPEDKPAMPMGGGMGGMGGMDF